MYITRWLTRHPLIAILALGLIAILLSWSGMNGDRTHDDGASHETQQLQNTKESEHDSVSLASAPVNNNSEEATTANNIQNDSSTAIPDTGDADSSVVVDSKALDNNTALANGNAVETLQASAQQAAPFLAKTQKTESHEENASKVSGELLKTEKQSSATAEINDKAEHGSDSVETASSTPTMQASPSATVTKTSLKTTAVQDLGSMSTEDMLVMAREAYWNNGLDEAAEIYTKLIELEPSVLEHKGELGNVYWRQGFPKKAADLYSEVAIPMIKEGKGERVANMIGFIGLFFPDRAAEINRQLQAKE